MKSLNKVQLIGNLTRDPELKYTPTGMAVVTFTIATNRSWTTDTGEKKEEADFTRVVAWNKLAEICGQLLKKGRKVYVEGRLSNRSYQDKDGVTKYISEVVINDMILLDSKPSGDSSEPVSITEEFDVPDQTVEEPKSEKKQVKSKKSDSKPEEVDTDDIPF
ncbi:MAG: single-stranded DNA-binding protein [bacterium]|nr:MAG: single-stranded DNA-binding protein [bacterium]